MARKPRKIKPGMGLIRVSFLLDAALLHRVDEEAVQMTAEDPYTPKRPTSRTDAFRSLIEDGLQARSQRRGKK